MADVLIVCVREDEPQAKALAEMFEAAGFSIGGAPSSDGALRSSGAGLVVWSQASIRSRPFLDAAQRVINAEKAVVASLIEPPPPSSIGDSPVFDLSNWHGDPNDPQLDPLFFAVDRMVNSARAAVGATAAPGPSSAYDAPRDAPRPSPARPTPPPMTTPPPATTYRQPQDELGSEAEHWRAIRDSRNPSDFMDYLARYGPDGAFSEVAELRLKQLTSQGAEGRSPSRQPVAPQRRDAAPPSRPMLPPGPDAPQRQREIQPLPRRADPARRPPPDRGFDRADLREPPTREAGPMRAIILIALLGGAALIGGLYFGGGMPNFGGGNAAQEEQIADASSTAPYDSGAGEPPSLDEPAGVPIEDLASSTPSRSEPAPARREPAAAAPAPRREEPRPRREESEAPPAPVTSWQGPSTGGGGPVNLSPGSSSPASGNSGLSTASPVVPQPSAPQRLATSRQGSVVWAARPTARRIGELYPDRAGRDGVGGRVELDCSVRSNLTLACSVASESPAGLGFGRAALNASNSYRARGALSDGADAIGARTRIVVQFQAPEQ